ncbi:MULTISPECIES: glycosyltransferase family 39 protein [unclassified Caulobacter]|uniref:ArnT family glycosyltransferase n=1 Tax=unclassified Caulobacter TaxID=2648921 RepID=UPI000701BBDB|nr:MULTISPECIES: glycosyltransferase family 39 protein [unclassified Caulobacter]KQV62656.1 4-amino-4-deoxy-L-arabinose transferase [Caulobacter sp. Root342]KQV71789.1 4-amino-4-deoxy-L-arabinose transferase [Caulobacter sp. Root343]
MTLESRLDDWSRGWRGPLFAALVALIAGLPGLFAMPPLDRDESRFAQATAQMLETGDYVVIKFQDQPRFKKPVGIHWLQAASVKLFSDAEDRRIWAYRIPSLLGAMLAAAACAWGAAALFDPRTGLLAGSILGATFLLSSEAFIAKTDAALCGTTTLAMAALARIYAAHLKGETSNRWTKFAFWIGLSVAALIKGPVGLMVAIFALIGLAICDRKAGWMKDLGWTWGLILFAAVVLPWAMMITVATDGAFWGAAVGGDLAPKLAGGQEGHAGPFGYHALLAPLLSFPATLLLPAGLVVGWTKRNEPGVRFAVCWLVPTWLMFEILPTKLVHYALPAYGALAMLMAAAVREPLGKLVRWIGAGLSVFIGLVLAGVAVYGLKAFGGRGDAAWAVLAALLALGAGVAGAVLLLRHHSARALITAGALGIGAHVALTAGLLPRLEPLFLSKDVADALDSAKLSPRSGAAGPVAVTGYSEPSLIFQLGTATELTDGEGAAQAILEGRPAVVEGREEKPFRAALAQQGLTPHPAAVIQGLNYSDGDQERLTLYRGEPPIPSSDDTDSTESQR